MFLSPGKFFRAIFEIEKGASEAMISDKMLPSGATLQEVMNKLKLNLKTAATGTGSSSIARKILGKILHVYVKVSYRNPSYLYDY